MTRYRLPLGGVHDAAAVRTVGRLLRSRLTAQRPGARTQHLADRARLAAEADGHPVRVAAATVRTRQGWIDTGLWLSAGQSVTILAEGTVWAARPLRMGIAAEVGLWLQAGDGAVTSMRGAAMVLTADVAGTLRVRAAEPGCLTEAGTIDGPRLRLSGAFSVVAVHWEHHGRAALAAAAATDPDLFGPALIRARSADRAPTGWTYHPRLGTADIFAEHGHGVDHEISCVTAGDVGILCRPVDVAVTEDLVLSWSWLIDALPSELPENIEPTHDYLSVAIEFDDGRDLTWLWSSHLEAETAFTCPLSYWRDRETHVVIRSGTEGLGRWTAEQRTIADDVRSYLPEPHPQRVVAIWLIANSVFQRRIGACRYRRLHLRTGNTLISLTA